jgi:hypothetical protein
MAASDLSKRIARWLRDPVSFITEVLRDPETGQPFALYPAQVEFLRRAFTLSPDGRRRYPELIFSEARRRRALENLLARANARSAIRMWRLPNSVASADYDEGALYSLIPPQRHCRQDFNR